MLESTEPGKEPAICVVVESLGHQNAAQKLPCDPLSCAFDLINAGVLLAVQGHPSYNDV